MGEDFETEDYCPKCGSSRVDTQWDEFGLVRLFLHCNNCLYIEAQNQCSDTGCEDSSEPWQTDPDAWKA